MRACILRNDFRFDVFVALAFCAAMWLTRSHHFATSAPLPDASWATFFLAGALARRWIAPAALLVNAAAIDYLALLGGVSDYCVTPAYPFLAPTYLSLWAAGRWASSVPQGSIRSTLRICVALLLGVAAAFLISNASFYAFAGYFDEMSALEYSQRVIRYLPTFLEGTALYSGIVLGIVTAWRTRPTLKASSASTPRVEY